LFDTHPPIPQDILSALLTSGESSTAKEGLSASVDSYGATDEEAYGADDGYGVEDADGETDDAFDGQLTNQFAYGVAQHDDDEIDDGEHQKEAAFFYGASDDYSKCRSLSPLLSFLTPPPPFSTQEKDYYANADSDDEETTNEPAPPSAPQKEIPREVEEQQPEPSPTPASKAKPFDVFFSQLLEGSRPMPLYNVQHNHHRKGSNNHANPVELEQHLRGDIGHGGFL